MSTALLSGTPCASPLFHSRYRPIKEVGSGGYSRVMQGVDTQQANRPVAVKQLFLRGLDMAERAVAKDMFMREALMLSQLHHARIPRLLDLWTETMPWTIVMDFIDGATLETYLAQRGGQLPMEEVVTIGLQLCTVLDYLHSQDLPVVFRDLKPANVLRTACGELFLIDFGLASRYRPDQAEKLALGTPGYAAPEQYPDCKGNTYPTPLSDIYALGATLHCLLSGIDPTRLQQSFRFPSLRGFSSPAGSTPLIKLIGAMLERDPARRPQNVAKIASALRYIQGN